MSGNTVWRRARTLLVLPLLALCFLLGGIALTQLVGTTPAPPSLPAPLSDALGTARPRDRVQSFLLYAVALTVVGALVPLAARGRPVARRARVSPAAHVSTPVWGLAVAWRAAVLPWLAAVLILAAGEAFAEVAPTIGAPPVARFIAVVIGLRAGVPADGGARLVACALWIVAVWATLNAIARLIDGLRTLGSPAFTDPTVWVIAPPPGSLASPTPTAAPTPAPNAAGTPGVAIPTTPQPTTAPATPTGALIQPRPFTPSCYGLTIVEPRAGWPPLPVPQEAPSWPAYCQACREWYERLRREVTPAHTKRLPTEGALEVRIGRAPSPTGRGEEALWAALARADLPGEPAPKSPLAKLCVRNRTLDSNAPTAYYVPDAATRDPATLLLIDIEIDGADHQRRIEADAQRDRFFQNSGWYVARLDLDAATGHGWDHHLPSDMRLLIERHQQAGRVAEAMP